MPRNPGTGQYSKPIPNAIPNTTIASAPYNLNVDDVVVDLNQPRPVVTGGTGATNAHDARSGLQAEMAMAYVTDYDSHVWENGSFWSEASAISSPVAGHVFGGTAIVINYDQGHVILYAHDHSDAAVPGTEYIREKHDGVWSAWVRADALLLDSKLADTGDTMTEHLRINEPNPQIILETSAGSAAANDIYGRVIGSTRWVLRLGDGIAETGGNAGSNFAVYRYDTAGAFLDTPLTITRVDGRLAIPNGLTAGLSVVGVAGANAPAIDAALKWSFLRACQPALRVDRRRTPHRGTRRLRTPPGTPVGAITTTSTTTAYSTSSGADLKEDLQPLAAAGTILDAVQVYDFRWKATGSRGHGVLAQQMQEVYPAAVTRDEDKDWWGVDYSKFTPLLLAEMKALRARVAQLETMLDKLI